MKNISAASPASQSFHFPPYIFDCCVLEMGRLEFMDYGKIVVRMPHMLYMVRQNALLGDNCVSAMVRNEHALSMTPTVALSATT